ncbi:MAG: ornithine carbamoyltransferase [bacterium]
MKRDLLSISDLSFDEIAVLIKNTFILKEKQKKLVKYQPLVGKSLGMLFQKPSTRTSISFAVGMYQLGGFPIMLSSRDLQLQRGESISDTGRVVERYLDLLMIRANKHSEAVGLSQNSSVPVINGLTDKEHPCQVLADVFTLIEKLSKSKKDFKEKLTKGVFNTLKVSFIGDSNNVANSWILASAVLGMNFVIACPIGFEPDKQIIALAQDLSAKSGAKIDITNDPKEAVKDSNIVYTDVWVSMGKEAEQEKRKSTFKDFQVNEKLMADALPDTLVMHCLPAKRGEEITAGVIDGPQSVIFDQAENRLHMQKAILLALSGIWEI